MGAHSGLLLSSVFNILPLELKVSLTFQESRPGGGSVILTGLHMMSFRITSNVRLWEKANILWIAFITLHSNRSMDILFKIQGSTSES